jgi:hypothetical protein
MIYQFAARPLVVAACRDARPGRLRSFLRSGHTKGLAAGLFSLLCGPPPPEFQSALVHVASGREQVG